MRFLRHARHMQTWKHLTQYIISTLPPSVDGAMHQPQVVYEGQKISLRKFISEDVPHFFIYGDILKLPIPSLNIFFDLNLVGPVMKQ
jgi:hypothetical protein